jgi:predicted small lipoprotein YifL
MKNFIRTTVKVSLVLFTLSVVSACGQKGPLKIDQPPVKTQTEESEQTK